MDKRAILTACVLTAALWAVNLIWLSRDSRPPVWDMALHQTYALNYASPVTPAMPIWERSGNYPPFVHLVIAFLFWLMHPGPRIAALANLPATLLLFWAVYQLALDFADHRAARWACVLTALTPYLIWMSRETILDYWLSAWVAVSLVVLRKTRAFQSHRWSLLFGGILALGCLTKWFFAAFLAAPILYVCIRTRIWKDSARFVHAADSVLVGGSIAALWYIPNLPALARYFVENAAVGAREGEPPVLSFQSFIYYLRLLEGYQLFALLFAVVAFSSIAVWRKRLLREGAFLYVAIAGGWVAMTLLRTKDPRFTMPLLGLLAVIAGTWLARLRGRMAAGLKAALVVLLAVQAYAASFGLPRLPKRIVLASGYQGSLAWDWNLYLQDYFGILGRPRREDWKLDEILLRLTREAPHKNAVPVVGVLFDLPRFNSANLLLRARILGTRVRVDHPQDASGGVHSLDSCNYVLMSDGDQGMPWSTRQSGALNQIILDDPTVFRLIALYPLPTGGTVRLYSVNPKSEIRNPQP